MKHCLIVGTDPDDIAIPADLIEDATACLAVVCEWLETTDPDTVEGLLVIFGRPDLDTLTDDLARIVIARNTRTVS